jgi:transposase
MTGMPALATWQMAKVAQVVGEAGGGPKDPEHFRHSRDVGCYLGLRPGRRNSGQSQPQLHIRKEGNTYSDFCWYKAHIIYLAGSVPIVI